MELLKKVRAGDEKAREELINGNLRLVLSVIQRFANRGENLDDLFQVGVIGLIKAVDNFNVDMGVRFSTYAVPMIIGECRRYLRDFNAVRVSRSMRDTAYKAMQVKERLMNETQREPTVEEIAKELGISKSDVVLALEAIVEPVSLYEPVYSDGGDTIYVMDQARYTKTREEILSEIAPRTILTDEELQMAINARSESFVPINEYKGGYEDPIVVIYREIGLDEIEWMKK